MNNGKVAELVDVPGMIAGRARSCGGTASECAVGAAAERNAEIMEAVRSSQLADALERGDRSWAPKLMQGTCRMHAMSEEDLALVIKLLRANQ